jgi:hypothetical protein
MFIPDEGHGEEQHATRLDDARNLVKEAIGIEDVLEHLKSNHSVERVVVKGKLIAVVEHIGLLLASIPFGVWLQPNVFIANEEPAIRFLSTSNVQNSAPHSRRELTDMEYQVSSCEVEGVDQRPQRPRIELLAGVPGSQFGKH